MIYKDPVMQLYLGLLPSRVNPRCGWPKVSTGKVGEDR